MKLVNFPKVDFGRFWFLSSTHVDQPKSTEKLNKAILFNLNCSMTGLKSKMLIFLVTSFLCSLEFVYVVIDRGTQEVPMKNI